MLLSPEAKSALVQLIIWRKALRGVTVWYNQAYQYPIVNTILLQVHLYQAVLWREVVANKKVDEKKVEFKGFANLEVPVDAKDAVKEFLRDNVSVSDAIEVLVLDGNKVTIVQSERNNSFQASAFCTYAKSPNAGYILTAFAGSWYDALGVLAWKHVVLSARGRWKDELTDTDMPEFG